MYTVSGKMVGSEDDAKSLMFFLVISILASIPKTKTQMTMVSNMPQSMWNPKTKEQSWNGNCVSGVETGGN